MYLLVGISSKPISRKICRNSVRTLFTGHRLSVIAGVGIRVGLLRSYGDVMLHSLSERP